MLAHHTQVVVYYIALLSRGESSFLYFTFREKESNQMNPGFNLGYVTWTILSFLPPTKV